MVSGVRGVLLIEYSIEHSIGLGLSQNSLLACYLQALCSLLTIVSWWAKDHRTALV